MKSGIIIIDKPAGWTSHDVVGKLRGLLKERRIGHGGTLDPMATGVLPVFVGRATRAAEFAASAEKEYTARLLLGVTTDTQDTTGSVIAESGEIPGPDEVKAAAECFSGDIMQTPPMYSAVKKDGQKLYTLARRGIEVEREPKSVSISALELVRLGEREYELKVRCSKGTYIRTLCHDIGQALGCGAAMSYLRRTRAGAFGLDSAVTLEELESLSGEAERYLIPVDSLFAKLPEIHISMMDESRCLNGAPFATGLPEGRYRVYGSEGFLALCEAKGGMMHTVKSFFEVNRLE